MVQAAAYYRHANREVSNGLLLVFSPWWVVLGWSQDVRDPWVFQHLIIFPNWVARGRFVTPKHCSLARLNVLAVASVQSTPNLQLCGNQKVPQGILRRKREKYIICIKTHSTWVRWCKEMTSWILWRLAEEVWIQITPTEPPSVPTTEVKTCPVTSYHTGSTKHKVAMCTGEAGEKGWEESVLQGCGVVCHLRAPGGSMCVLSSSHSAVLPN